jgi:pimeloyl-ACP methyl ester carboxylesterase
MESKISKESADETAEPLKAAEPSKRRLWKGILASMLILATVYACRGWLLAWLVGGSYRWTNLFVDCIVLALVILVFRLLDLGVKKLVHRCIGDQSRNRRALAVLLNWSVVLVLAAPFCIALVQFHPQKIGCGATPADFGLPYTDVQLESDGLRLSAWHLPASSPTRPVVVVCHGLGANKQNFLPAAAVVHGLDYNVLLFDFRGHGDSEGRTFTFGVKESRDVKAARDFVRRQHPTSSVYGLGYSVGGSTLLKMAGEHAGFDKIVIDSSFANAETVALHSMLWYFGPLKRSTWHVGRFWGWVFSGTDIGQHNPEEYIAGVRCPILLIHGAADAMIPASESQRLDEIAGKSSRLWIVDNLGHLQTMGHPDYRSRLQKFFEE